MWTKSRDLLTLFQNRLNHYFFQFTNCTQRLEKFFLNALQTTRESATITLLTLLLVISVDSLLIDDEPLWEPIEWSMVQSWILFIYLFSWIAENLIVSRYGSYTGRDKRIWFSWYKTFWGLELIYVLSLGAAILCVITPFYYEVNYLLSFSLSWWNWYSQTFFFKFVSLYTLVIFLAYILQINVRFFNWKKTLLLVLLINLFLLYLLYIYFFLSFFSYFTNVNWYNSARLVDYAQLSHEPHKWAWGNKKRDHFSYHKSSTVFWFKNDGPMAEGLMLIHLFFFLAIFFLTLYWLVLARRIYVVKEVSYTYTTYCISALKQFLYFLFFLYCLNFFSYVVTFWRLPLEYTWVLSSDSWSKVFVEVASSTSDCALRYFFQSSNKLNIVETFYIAYWVYRIVVVTTLRR
jgi:hypothetical protein